MRHKQAMVLYRLQKKNISVFFLSHNKCLLGTNDNNFNCVLFPMSTRFESGAK
jgi:hypothetical protein